MYFKLYLKTYQKHYLYYTHLFRFLLFTELAYITTPICLLQCAYVLMSERDKMPEWLENYSLCPLLGMLHRPIRDTNYATVLPPFVKMINVTNFYFYSGGVMTPGMAFAKTKLIERLHRHGVQYEVISQN